MDLVVAHCYLGHFKKLRIIIIRGRIFYFEDGGYQPSCIFNCDKRISLELLLLLHVCDVLCGTVAYSSPSSKEFHNCSPRSVSRFVAALCQQIHGGEPLLILRSWRSPLRFLCTTCNDVVCWLVHVVHMEISIS